MTWREYARAQRGTRSHKKKYQIQVEASHNLSDSDFDRFEGRVVWYSPELYGMGLNKNPNSPDWEKTLNEIRELMNEDEVLRVSWSCSDRASHFQYAKQLEAALPEFEFDIEYDNYKCAIMRRD